MTEVWSGGIVYMYFETENEYGLVSVTNNKVSTLGDYSNLSKAMATVSPSGVNSASYSPTNTIASCPATGTAWAAVASPLPPSPNKELCQCMFNSLSCTVKSSVDAENYGDMFGYVCGADPGACAGIQHVSYSHSTNTRRKADIFTERYHWHLRCLQHVQLHRAARLRP
jgi:hypothetical protein